MTRFIVHIGDGKCGSSSIQKSLFEAREDLRQAGILYETSVPKNGQFSLISLIGRGTRGPADAVAEQTRQTLEMIRANLQPGDTVLLSGESFFSVPPEQMMQILQAIAPEIGQLDIIAYVRSPHSMYLSLTQQTLKASSTYVKPDAYVRRLDSILSAWASFDRTNSVTVRHFDRAHLVGGDAVADFEQVLRDITGQSGLQLPRSVENTSLSAEQMVVLQRFRTAFLKEMDGKFSPQSNHLIQCFEKMNSTGLVGHKPQLSDHAKSVVCQANAVVVENLGRQFPGLVLDNTAPQFDGVRDLAPWAWSDGVQDILAHCDDELVAHLMKLVPGFSPALQGGMTAAAEQAVRTILNLPRVTCDEVIGAVRNYWRRSGCARAAQQLDALQLCQKLPDIVG